MLTIHLDSYVLSKILHDGRKTYQPRQRNNDNNNILQCKYKDAHLRLKYLNTRVQNYPTDRTLNLKYDGSFINAQNYGT